MKNSVKKVVDSRLASKQDYGDDLLGIMLKSCESERNERKLSIEEIIDEWKTFFFGGYETNSNLLTWTTMLLSLHQDWQEKLRHEIFEECGKDKTPDSDTFSKLKLLIKCLLVVQVKVFLVVEETYLSLVDEHGVLGVASPVRTSIIFLQRCNKGSDARAPKDPQGHNDSFPSYEDAQRQGRLGIRR